MRNPIWIIALALLPSLAQAWPWSNDMANQISIKPQEKPMLFPSRSVPVSATATQIVDRAKVNDLPNPVSVNAESVKVGKQLFTIYCTPCHGTGAGDGLVGEKLILRPFDLTSDNVKSQPDGFIFGYMTFGGAVMPPYANDLSPTERWHVVNFIRKGLKSASATAQADSAK